MSHQTRARKLSAVSQKPYQTCLVFVHEHAAEAEQMARDRRWPVPRADAFLFDNGLDAEYAGVAMEADYVRARGCEECGATFFAGSDKKGIPTTQDKFCPACLEEGTHECARCSEPILGHGDGEADFCENCKSWLASQ